MESRPTFDTKEGIAAALADYPTFYALLAARRDSPQAGENGLERYVVPNGNVLLGEDGTAQRFLDEIDGGAPPKIAEAVLTFKEYLAERAAQGRAEAGYGWQSVAYPPPHVVCAHCGRAFEMKDVRDLGSDSGDYEMMDLGPHIGQTLGDVVATFASRTGAQYSGFDRVRNDGWKTHSYATHRRQIARHEGWRDENDDDPQITPDYVIQPGDECCLEAGRFFHRACQIEYERTAAAEAAAEQSAAEITVYRSILEHAGFENVRLESLTELPSHVMAFLCGDLDLQDDEAALASAASEVRYLKISTNLVSFGIFTAAYPMLDLTDTGVTLEELGADLGGGALGPGVPEDMSWMCMLGSTAVLQSFWKLLAKKKLAAIAAAT